MQIRIFSMLALAASGIWLGQCSPGLAGETTITGADGKVTTVNTVVNRINNTTSFDRTTTYPNGKTSESIGILNNTGNGKYSGTITHINRKGVTNSATVNGQVTHSNGTFTNTGTVTGQNGKVTTYNNTRTCQQGICNGDRVTTFADGTTRNVVTNSTRTSPGNFTGTANVTRRNGSTNTVNFKHTR